MDTYLYLLKCFLIKHNVETSFSNLQWKISTYIISSKHSFHRNMYSKKEYGINDFSFCKKRILYFCVQWYLIYGHIMVISSRLIRLYFVLFCLFKSRTMQHQPVEVIKGTLDVVYIYLIFYNIWTSMLNTHYKSIHELFYGLCESVFHKDNDSCKINIKSNVSFLNKFLDIECTPLIRPKSFLYERLILCEWANKHLTLILYLALSTNIFHYVVLTWKWI